MEKEKFRDRVMPILLTLITHTAFFLCFSMSMFGSTPRGFNMLGSFGIYLVWIFFWVMPDIFWIRDEIRPELHECATILQDAILGIMGNKK